jgi:membrane protease YdiL (CAAX protease family)
MGPTGSLARRPYIFTMLIVASIAVVNVVSAGTGAALPELPPTLLELLAELVLAGLAIALLTAQRSWKNVGFRSFPRLKDLRLYWVPLFPVLPVGAAAIIGISRMPFEEILFFLVLACLVGFVEEVVFRGLILQALAPAGLWRAAILSSILFGMMHLLNLLFGADLVATLLQAAYATAMGFGFAAVTLRTGVLWPLIVIHALIDFAGFVTMEGTVTSGVTSTDFVIYILYSVVFAAYGLFMMRAVTRSAGLGEHRPIPAGTRP